MKKRNTALVFITSWTILISGIYAQELNRKIDEVMNAFVRLDQFS